MSDWRDTKYRTTPPVNHLAEAADFKAVVAVSGVVGLILLSVGVVVVSIIAALIGS